MNTELTDIGCNLTHESFAADRAAVLARALAAGVTRQIVTGADLASSSAALALAHANPGRLWSTAGVHPHHASRFAADGAGLRELLQAPSVVAVGECGLDYHRDVSPRSAQRAAFVAQLDLAVSTAKPVFLHQRDAHADFTSILQDFRGRLRGVAHCFTGDAAQLQAYLELDLRIGITGWICDERRGLHLRDLVPLIPADRLMLETDAPYLLPRDLRPRPPSRRNEPALLVHLARTVATARGESFDAVAAATTRTAIEFFGLGA